MKDDIIVGYAHIDYENKYWFGICVLEHYKNKGYGTQLMKYIFNHEKIKKINEICLTVDKINNIAMHLYLKFNFTIIDEKDTLYFMKRINE